MGSAVGDERVQGYLAHTKQRPPRTLQSDHALGPMVALGGGAVSYERGTPVHAHRLSPLFHLMTPLGSRLPHQTLVTWRVWCQVLHLRDTGFGV